MGFCGDFVCRIGGDCSHRMEVRDEASCHCPACGVVCRGRFPGCKTIWARGPVPAASLFADEQGLISPFDPVTEEWLRAPGGPTVRTADDISTAHENVATPDPSPAPAQQPSQHAETDRRIEELTKAVAEQAAVTARLLEVVERLEAMALRGSVLPGPDEHLPGLDLRSLFGHSAVLLESHGSPSAAPGHGHGNGESHPHVHTAPRGGNGLHRLPS